MKPTESDTLFKDDEIFDSAIIGTTFSNCVAVLYYTFELSGFLICRLREELDAGRSVLNIEKYHTYGSFHEAFLRAIPEDLTFAETLLSAKIIKSDTFEFSKQILFDLNPYVIFGTSELSSFIVQMELSNYVEFRMVDRIGFVFESCPILLPKAKEDIMLDSALSLLEKRQLMKLTSQCRNFQDIISGQTSFVEFAHSLGVTSKRILDMILYGICHYSTIDEGESADTNTVALHITKYQTSLDKFGGKCALVYPLYGCNSIIQAMCRSAAVKGAVQILDQQDVTVQHKNISGVFEGKTWNVKVKNIIEHAHSAIKKMYRVIAIVTRGLFGDSGCNFWVFPPSNTQSATIFCLQTDSESGCCSKEFLILHFWSTLGLTLDKVKEILQQQSIDHQLLIEYASESTVNKET